MNEDTLIMQTFPRSLAALVATCFLGTAHCYDLASDFSPTAGNPNGTWNYGWATFSIPVTRFDSLQGSGGPLYTWQQSNRPNGASLIYNSASDVFHTEGFDLNPHAIALRPGQDGEYGAVVWKAPVAGTYEIRGSFIGLSGPSSEMYIYAPGVSIDKLLGKGMAVPFNFTTTFTKDFPLMIMGVGGSGDGFNGDAIGLSAHIMAVPEVGTFEMAIAGLLGLIAWTRLRARHCGA
jgi:hypothetical protein